MDKLEALHCFVAVIDHGGISPAARTLGLSRSSVSKTISQLEQTLSAKLLNRTTRHISPTATGSAYYQRAKQILSDMQEADDAVQQLETTTSGTLRLNAPMSFGIRHLGPAIADFMALYPDITVDANLSDSFINPVEGGFDLTLRIAELEDSSLIASKIAPIRRTLCATPDYLANAPALAHPEDLANHTCLHYGIMTPAISWRFDTEASSNALSVPIAASLCSNNGEILLAAALKDRGIAYLPTFLVGPDLQSGRLVSLLCEHRPADIALYALYPPSRHLSVRLRLFIDFLKARFGPNPFWDLVD